MPSGPKRQLVVVVLERVHLFLDDVGDLADLAHEQRRRFDEWRPNLFVTVELYRRAKRVLETMPPPDFLGEDVVHPLDGARVHRKGPRLWSGGRSGSTRFESWGWADVLEP